MNESETCSVQLHRVNSYSCCYKKNRIQVEKPTLGNQGRPCVAMAKRESYTVQWFMT
jgi:hypothetical protein